MRTLAPWLVLVLFIGAGCGGDTKKGSKEKKGSQEEAFAAPRRDGSPRPEEAEKKDEEQKGEKKPADQPREAVKRKIIYTAELSVIVEDLNKAEDALLALVDKNQGIIARSSIIGTTGEPRQGRWRLRVPVERFRPFLRGVLQLGVPEVNSTDSEDVTGRFYDLEAELKTHKADEEAARKELAQAVKAAERKTLREELRQIRTAIEKIEGEYKRLANLTALTTLNVTLREVKNYVPPEAPAPPTFGNTLKETFNDSLGALVSFGKGLVVVAVAVAPWLPPAAFILVPAWLILRRKLKRQRLAAEPPLLSAHE